MVRPVLVNAVVFPTTVTHFKISPVTALNLGQEHLDVTRELERVCRQTGKPLLDLDSGIYIM